MRSPHQTLTKRFEIKAYADDVTEITIDLNHDDFQAVAKVLQQLNEAGTGYAPKFKVSEVGADGEIRREVISL